MELLLGAGAFFGSVQRAEDLVHPEALALLGDVIGWNAHVESEVDGGGDLGTGFLAAQLLHGALEHLAVELEADRIDVTVLFPSQKIAGPAQLHVEGGNAEPGPELAEFLERAQTVTRFPPKSPRRPARSKYA